MSDWYYEQKARRESFKGEERECECGRFFWARVPNQYRCGHEECKAQRLREKQLATDFEFEKAANNYFKNLSYGNDHN